jgi:hypothetical protein
MEEGEIQVAETSFTVELVGLHEESMWIPLISVIGDECNIRVIETTVKYNYIEEKYCISVKHEGLLVDIKRFNDMLKQKSDEIIRDRNVDRKLKVARVN